MEETVPLLQKGKLRKVFHGGHVCNWISHCQNQNLSHPLIQTKYDTAGYLYKNKLINFLVTCLSFRIQTLNEQNYMYIDIGMDGNDGDLMQHKLCNMTHIHPSAPERPLDSDCCGNGCTPCVFDIYEEEVTVWKAECERLRDCQAEGYQERDSDQKVNSL